MNRTFKIFFCVVAATWGFSAGAATPSVDGSNIFAHPSIIDAQGNTWTIVSGVIEKNGTRVGVNYNVDLLLEFDQVFYQRNTSDEWYEWTGSSWSQTTDPRVVSSSGAKVGVSGGRLVDSQSHVWVVPQDNYAYMDGFRADGNYNTIALVYYKNVIYCENTRNEWYSWNGSTWTRVSGDPTTNDMTVVSANGASIGVGTNTLVDSAGNIWTLQTNEIAYRNGERADGNYSTISLLYYNDKIYCENTSAEWYSWSGSAWTKVAGSPESAGGTPVSSSPPASTDPRGPSLVQYIDYSSPVCPAAEPNCTPQFVGNSGVTFTQVTTKGNTIWVAATVSDYGGIHAITVTDSQNNTYHELNQGNDGAPGSQSVAQFYASNIAGGSDTVTVNWSSDNYKGVVAAEIAGVTGSPLLGNGVDIQDGKIGTGNDNVASQDMSVSAAATPALLVALTMDTDGGGSDTGGTGFCAISPGTGFTQVAQLWNWSPTGSAACNLATLETRTVTAAGSVAGTFTTPHLSDSYVTVAAAFH